MKPIWKCSPGTASLAEVEFDNERLLAAQIRVRAGEGGPRVENQPACIVRYRICIEDHVTIVFLMFRFDGSDQTYISTINLCDEFAVVDMFRSWASARPLAIFLFEDEPEPIGGWGIEPSVEPWTSLVTAVADHGNWTRDEFVRSLKSVLTKIGQENLWEHPPVPCVHVIGNEADLDRVAGILREEGKGELVDELHASFRRQHDQEILKRMLAALPVGTPCDPSPSTSPWP